MISKFIQYTLIIVGTVTLFGCGANITAENWAWGEKMCKPNGGLERAHAGGIADKYADLFVCRNGAEFKFPYTVTGKQIKTEAEIVK